MPVLVNFQISRMSFVATATAVGLIVDCARMPVYFLDRGTEIILNYEVLFVSDFGVTLGTLLGARFLKSIPEYTFKKIVSVLIFALGLTMILKSSPNS